jgi:hypothetical protein
MNITFEELVQAVHQLPTAQKSALIHSLRDDTAFNAPLTREQALLELQALRLAGAFDGVESLYGKYEHLVDVSDDELNAYLCEIGNAWEGDFDDLITD